MRDHSVMAARVVWATTIVKQSFQTGNGMSYDWPSLEAWATEFRAERLLLVSELHLCYVANVVMGVSCRRISYNVGRV